MFLDFCIAYHSHTCITSSLSQHLLLTVTTILYSLWQEIFKKTVISLFSTGPTISLESMKEKYKTIPQQILTLFKLLCALPRATQRRRLLLGQEILTVHYVQLLIVTYNSFMCHIQFQKARKWKGHRPLIQVPAVAQGFGKQRELCVQDPFFEEKVAYCILQGSKE